MRFVIHTPRTHVAEWEVTGLPGDTPDAAVVEILTGGEAVPGVRAKRLSAKTVDAGPPYVYARGADDLEVAGQRIREARAAEAAAVEAAREVAVAAMDAGQASERQIAAAFGVDRNTVRAWRGKTR